MHDPSNSVNDSPSFRRYPADFSKFFRHLLRRTNKQPTLKSDKEMTNLSAVLMKPSETTETLASINNNAHHQDLCLFSESPHYIVRVSRHLCPSFSILTSAHRSPRSRVQATSTSSTDSFATTPPSSQSPILLDSVLLTMLLPATKWPFWRSSCSSTEVHPSSIHPHPD